jgi:bifunctional non-homologous end joining protein LigD
VPKRNVLEVDGRKVQVSNLEKVLYPANQFTKAQVIDYYIRVSQYLLPHFRNRPVTLKRYPDGIRGEFFYEKDAPRFTPDWVQTFPVPRRAGGKDIQYVLINDLGTLVWCANLASIELHPFLHRPPKLDQPDFVVFDLDPGPGTDILTCAEVAFLLRELLAGADLECWPKVSGSKGLQIYVPLNVPVTYSVSQPFARAVAELLAQQHPALVVAEMAKSERPGKIFIDWSQNSDFKTTVGVYSLRAKRDTPFVSLPVTWDELAAARKSKSPDKLYWDPAAALERLQSVGDLFAPVLNVRQKLPDSIGKGPPPAKSPAPSKSSSQSSSGASTRGARKRAVRRRPGNG